MGPLPFTASGFLYAAVVVTVSANSPHPRLGPRGAASPCRETQGIERPVRTYRRRGVPLM
jgi:hypothetical protein